MEFFNGEKVIVARNIKTESGEMIKCAEEVIITKIRPDLISVQWNKDKRELNALTPPDSIFKYTESNRQIADNRKEFLNLLAMQKTAIDVQGFLGRVKEYWDKNKADVKAALEFIGKTIKNRIADFTGEFDKLYNGLKGIIGVQYTETLAQYIPDLAANKVAKMKTSMVKTSANMDQVFIKAEDSYVPSDAVYDVILNRLSNLLGDNYPHEVVASVVPTIAEYTDDQKKLILKISKLAENYRVAQSVLPLAFLDKEDLDIVTAEEDKALEIADKYDVKNKNKKLKTKQVVNEEKRPCQLLPAKGAQPEMAEIDRINADPNSNAGHFF